MIAVGPKRKSRTVFMLATLLVGISIIGISILATNATSMSNKNITNTEVVQAPKVLSAIINYVNNYKQTHDGAWPEVYCDTSSIDGEWIDEIAGKTNKHFEFFYAIDFTGNIYVGAEGKADPFSSEDTLTFYFVKGENITNTWQGTGRLQDVKPNKIL